MSAVSSLQLKKTTESGYLLVIGYVRKFCRIFKLSHRIDLKLQLMIVMYYPPNYHIFGLDTDINTRIRYKKLEVFSLLCDDRNGIWSNYDRYIIKTALKDIYFSWNYDASSSSSGFFKLPQNKNNTRNDYVNIISDGKFGEHGVIVSQNNYFYGFGPWPNDPHDASNSVLRNGTNNKKLYTLTAMKRVFRGITLKQIKCGSHHTIFLTTTGRIYCCGCNGNGQIGILHHKHYQAEPTLIPFLYDVIEIDCGRKHNLCLDCRGNVWCFGCNDQGQLGLPYVDHSYVDVPVVNQWFRFNDIKIKTIRCGYDFSLCIDHKGYVYLFGCNETGQIGNGKENEYKVSTPSFLFGIPIRCASLGDNHCVLVDVYNNIWTFGANDNSQCSVSMRSDRNILRPYHLQKQEVGISRRRHIYKAIAGHASTLIVTSCVLMYVDSDVFCVSV